MANYNYLYVFDYDKVQIIEIKINYDFTNLNTELNKVGLNINNCNYIISDKPLNIIRDNSK